jgi:hypothetical protein
VGVGVGVGVTTFVGVGVTTGLAVIVGTTVLAGVVGTDLTGVTVFAVGVIVAFGITGALVAMVFFACFKASFIATFIALVVPDAQEIVLTVIPWLAINFASSAFQFSIV